MKLQRPLSSLKATAARRKEGYVQACLNIGKLNESTGVVTFTNEGWHLIRTQYRMDAASKLPLGDMLHTIAGPIARALKFPCLKGDGTTDLRPESPCARRQAAANQLGNKIVTSATTAATSVFTAAKRLILPPR